MISRSLSAHTLPPTAVSEGRKNALLRPQTTSLDQNRSKLKSLARSHSLSTKLNYDDLRQSVNCCICLETISAKSKNVTTPCLHRFHRTCLNSWTKNFHHTTCPTCKSDIKTETKREESAVRYFQFESFSTLNDLDALDSCASETSSPYEHLLTSFNEMSNEEINDFFKKIWNYLIFAFLITAGLTYYFDR